MIYSVLIVGIILALHFISCYGLDGPGIESLWGRGFPHPYRPALEPTCKLGSGSLPPDFGFDHQLPAGAEVKERV
jgi:hypothetical protein